VLEKIVRKCIYGRGITFIHIHMTAVPTLELAFASKELKRREITNVGFFV